MHTATTWYPLISLAIMMLTLLTSCGSSATTVDPLLVYKSQTLAWQACGDEFRTALGPESSQKLDALGTRAKCAFMKAPLDYSDVAKGDIRVALLRISAEDQTRRMGAIVFNPGGPGNDGLSGPLIFSAVWSLFDTSDPVKALYKQMSRSYDLVGFSPRGTGLSTSLTCLSDLFFRFVTSTSIDPSDKNYSDIMYNSKLIADTCQKNPLTPYINSDATARDMDLMRHLFGDAKLNYIGYSYGTWLGTWYAGLFPDRVGRMLLVGMTDITQPLSDTMFLTQEMGQQRVIDELLAPYAARHPERFALGNTPQAVRNAYSGLRYAPGYLLTTLREALAISDSNEADNTLLYLRAAQLMEGFISANPAADQKAVSTWIASASFVPDAGLNLKARELAEILNGSYFEKVSQQLESATLIGKNALAYTIACNDAGSSYTEYTWIAASRSSSALYPLYGGFWAQNACIYWGAPVVSRPPVTAVNKAGTIMILQSELDPWTVREGAFKSFEVLSNARMIVVQNEYTHGLMLPYGSEYIDRPVAEYFLFGTAPKRLSYFAGKALAADVN